MSSASGGGLALLLAILCHAPIAAAQLYAERITEANASARRVGGPDAIGGIGDWALGNGTLCAVISDPEHESILSTRGGVLIDLAHCERADDHFHVLQPLFNLSRRLVLPVSEVRAETTPAEARMVTRGRHGGVTFETAYAMDLREPWRLRIRTRLERTAEGEDLFLFGEVCLHGRRSLTPFTASTKDAGRSVGFVHPPVDVERTLSMVRAIVPADLQVLVGPDSAAPGIAYGLLLDAVRLERANGESRALPYLALDGESFSLTGAFTRPFWLGGRGSIGLLELVQTLFMDLDVGDSLVYERSILVGERSDVASVTDRIYARGARVSGRVDDHRARLHVHDVAGRPVTELRPDADGRFAFRVPPGRYEIRAIAPGGRELRRLLTAGGALLDLGELRVGRPSRVLLPRGAAMRLVFLGIEPTETPRFGDDLLGFRVGLEDPPPSALANDVSLAGLPGDPESVVLAPGRYRVLASRGPEFTVTETAIEVGAGETARLTIEPPERALASPGWISADLHVHAERSDDSTLPLRARLASFAAQGAEILVATDHDVVSDYAPLIRAIGLAGAIASVSGVEVTGTVRGGETPYTIGHANAFPLPFAAQHYRGGAPVSEGRRLRRLIADVRRLGGERVVQINHPRNRSGRREDGNLFSHLSVVGEPFDPTRPLDREPNRVLVEVDSATGFRDLDFDAIELLNGSSMTQYRLTRADWFALLLQGEFRAATASSDSHSAGEVVALPRTYVRSSDDRVTAFDVEAFVRALRAGQAFGTTGPLLAVQLGEAGIGERFVGSEGLLRVAVDAAPWVPVSRARVFVDGARVHELEIRAGGAVEVPLRFEADAFVTVEVEGDVDDVFAAVAPSFTPFAFTNPIFVDADGDGRWTPPGLPVELPPAIVDPLAD